mgnify:CR=1 FL=1|tara:strand:+ start:19135 stop:19365 length:231 start_codon:yes stop_codon:yes gene_type:complete
MSKITHTILTITLLSLTGCFAADKVDKAQQDYVCSDRGGVNEYIFSAIHKVQCLDGSYQEWVDTIIPRDRLVKQEK